MRLTKHSNLFFRSYFRNHPWLLIGQMLIRITRTLFSYFFLHIHAKYSYSTSWNLFPLATVYMSYYFLFAYDITHDISIRAQCIDFKKNLNVIPASKNKLLEKFVVTTIDYLSILEFQPKVSYVPNEIYLLLFGTTTSFIRCCVELSLDQFVWRVVRCLNSSLVNNRLKTYRAKYWLINIVSFMRKTLLFYEPTYMTKSRYNNTLLNQGPRRSMASSKAAPHPSGSRAPLAPIFGGEFL